MVLRTIPPQLFTLLTQDKLATYFPLISNHLEALFTALKLVF